MKAPRSAYDTTGGMSYFPRMLDKIRLKTAGQLPADYQENYGDSKPGMFDTRCCAFLRVDFKSIEARTREGGTDEEILAWAEARGGRRSDEECLVWNGFLMKRGWHDSAESLLRSRPRTTRPT